MRFNNPVPIALDITPEDIEIKSTDEGVDVLIEPEGSEEPEEKPLKEGETIDITPEEEEVTEIVSESNGYLQTINALHDLGIIEETYEGFDPEEEPTLEIQNKLIQHNLELKQAKAVEEFVEAISPLAQRILSFDLNSKGENLQLYLKTLVEENSIKELKVENEYDQEKIVRMWYSDENYTPEEIEEKIEELRTSSLLEKEAKRVKPKLDSRAEQIAKQKEESEAEFKKQELQRDAQFMDRLEKIIETGTVGTLKLSKEDAQQVMALLILKDMKVRIPGGKELKMSYLDAEIMKHKYSTQGNPELLIQAAYLLTNPDSFYKQFANVAKADEVNKFTKEHKYNFQTKSLPAPEKKKTESKNIPWNFKVPQQKVF